MELDAPALVLDPTIELAVPEDKCRAPTTLRVEEAGELRLEEDCEVVLLGKCVHDFTV